MTNSYDLPFSWFNTFNKMPYFTFLKHGITVCCVYGKNNIFPCVMIDFL